MEKLPAEVGLDILSRLSIASLIQVKSVCRSWRMLAHHPLLPHLHLSRMAHQTHDSSLLLLSHSPIQNILYSLQFSSSNIETTLTRIPLSMSINPHFSLAGSCNGFFCLLNQHDQAFICNLFTTDCIQLPKPEQHFHIQHRVASGFGFLSSKNEYKVVRIAYYQTNQVEDASIRNTRTRKPLPEGHIEVLTLGDGVLTLRNKGKTSYQILGRPSNVVVEERLHWLTCKYRNSSVRKIICFDLADEEVRQVPSPRGAAMFGRRCMHLVSLKGCLGGVVQGYKCLYIWVMKEYGVEDSWIKEYTISQLNPSADQSINSQCFPLIFSQVRVLCILQNGDILLQHKGKYVVAFDPNSRLFRELEIPGLPQDFNAVVYISN